jgi:hypothetical protein
MTVATVSTLLDTNGIWRRGSPALVATPSNRISTWRIAIAAGSEALGLGDSLNVKTGTAGGVAADGPSGASNTAAMHPILATCRARRPARVAIVASNGSWCMAFNTPLSRLSTDHAHFGAAYPARKRRQYFLQFGAARAGIE